jgi:hypothetical protein
MPGRPAGGEEEAQSACRRRRQRLMMGLWAGRALGVVQAPLRRHHDRPWYCLNHVLAYILTTALLFPPVVSVFCRTATPS